MVQQPQDQDDSLTVRKVFTQALSIYEDREAKYGEAWRDRGWRGNVADILRKASRVKNVFWRGEGSEDRDDLYDLMVYCAFAIINMDDDREWE